MFNEEEIKKAIRYVKYDIIDDFWPDILEYKDLLDCDFSEINFDEYAPNDTFFLDVPKLNLILRPAQYVDFWDRVYYQLIVNRFAKNIDSKLSPCGSSFGYRTSKSDSKFVVNGVNSWKNWQEKTKQNFKRNSHGLLLKTDINAFFEHIEIEHLIKVLCSLNIESKEVSKLRELLHYWSESGMGIPQNNDCSSFLANVYLSDVDKAMIATGYKYYRFMDDIRVFCDNELETQEAIKKLTELLRPLNLHLNGGKTEVVDFKGYLNEVNSGDLENHVLEYSINSDIDKYCSEIEDDLIDLWRDAISVNEINNRKFKYCINRFRRIKSSFPIEDILKHDLYSPAFTMEICNFLSSFADRKDVQNKVVEVLNKTPYEFQSIFLLRILSKAKKTFFNIDEIDWDRLLRFNNFMITGYHFVLIGRFGTDGQKINMQKLFRREYVDNNKIARYYIIALESFHDRKATMNKLVQKKHFLKKTKDYLLKDKKS
ncbi:RNA-directed DNA polymerase [Patescibacteria group bacterium]